MDAMRCQLTVGLRPGTRGSACDEGDACSMRGRGVVGCRNEKQARSCCADITVGLKPVDRSLAEACAGAGRVAVCTGRDIPSLLFFILFT